MIIHSHWATAQKVSVIDAYKKWTQLIPFKIICASRKCTEIQRCGIGKSNKSNGHNAITIFSKFLSSWSHCWTFDRVQLKRYWPMPHRNHILRLSDRIVVCDGGRCWLKKMPKQIWVKWLTFLFRHTQFYNEHDQLLSRYTGEIFRPPIMEIEARLVRILFFANDGTGTGYSATINYSMKNATNEATSTHCGGMVESYGGAITMMNMTNSSAAAFDCIWLVKPSNSYLHLKTHLLVRIDTFENMGKFSTN